MVPHSTSAVVALLCQMHRVLVNLRNFSSCLF